jgi:carboxylate-amine ligase
MGVTVPEERHALRFLPSPGGHTVGVEIELQLLAPETLAFANVAPDALRGIAPEFSGRITEELLQCMVEVKTRPCAAPAELGRDLHASVMHLERRLHALGAVIYSASLHPFETGTGENVMPDPRYERIMDELQLVGRQFITQGLHVHVGVSGGDEAVAACNGLRRYLPMLLALTTSSPLYEGRPTGLLSWRSKLFGALPHTGVPEHMHGWEGFMETVSALMTGGVISSVKDLWWDVRPHPEFGTVEVRICDLPCRLSETVAIAALVQALVVAVLSAPPERPGQTVLHRANKWFAARHGLGGDFIDPLTAERTPMRDALARMFALAREAAEGLGTAEYIAHAASIMERGTGAHRQLAVYAETGDVLAVIRAMQREFMQ